jgi:hypothetical protein
MTAFVVAAASSALPASLQPSAPQKHVSYLFVSLSDCHSVYTCIVHIERRRARERERGFSMTAYMRALSGTCIAIIGLTIGAGGKGGATAPPALVFGGFANLQHSSSAQSSASHQHQHCLSSSSSCHCIRAACICARLVRAARLHIYPAS